PEAVAPAEEPTYKNGVLPGAVLMVLLLALMQARLTGAPQGAELSLRVGVLFCAGALVARSLLLGRSLRSLLERERQTLSRRAEGCARRTPRAASVARGCCSACGTAPARTPSPWPSGCGPPWSVPPCPTPMPRPGC